MTNILEIDSVLLEFELHRILHSVYLKCETGNVTGLLGRNGTGKSSLMKILFGELIPNEKFMRINGVPVYGTYRSPKNIRYLPQNRFAPSSLTVKRIFQDFSLDFEGLISIFPEFEILYNSKMINLSGGERRIIEIYLILASKTKFCMLDEPFSQIEPIHVDSIKKLILREKENKGILITDHMYKHVIDICDDLYVINNGQIYLTKNMKDIETLGYARIGENNSW